MIGPCGRDKSSASIEQKSGILDHPPPPWQRGVGTLSCQCLPMTKPSSSFSISENTLVFSFNVLSLVPALPGGGTIFLALWGTSGSPWSPVVICPLSPGWLVCSIKQECLNSPHSAHKLKRLPCPFPDSPESVLQGTRESIR